MLAVYDSRDHIFQPTKGFFVQASVFTSASILGSSFSFSKFSFDARHYQTIKGDHILATNLFVGNTGEGTPFFSLNYLGNNNRSRGFNDRRFQDHGELSMAVEDRFPISGRFGGVGFASTGTVAQDFSSLFSSKYRSAAGLGVRYTINKKDGIRIRVDYGLSKEGGNIYFTVREAF
jgi:outer membrane protein assembly factor BamA